MYFPYFRGKQYELITIRDSAELMSDAGFVPIIEPVKEALKGLGRALDAVCEHGGRAVVVVNPYHGNLVGKGEAISDLLQEEYLAQDNICAGILLRETTTLEEAIQLYNDHADHSPYFIHWGFREENGLVEFLQPNLENTRHVFFEKTSSVLYRRKFANATRILLRDSFNKQKNADYPPTEFFSDLHVTYESEFGLDGFGDFLTVGDDYSETGGPAYAVAIHTTFVDEDQDEQMYVHHYVSETNNTPTDPAGKFAEALEKLADDYNSGTSKLFLGKALSEFLSLHERQHFPGLGQVKKLSMLHHIETLADYF